MASQFWLQIVSKDAPSVVLQIEPGRQAERDFVADVVTRAVAKGVGLFRTEAQVETAIREAIQESIFDLKQQITP